MLIRAYSWAFVLPLLIGTQAFAADAFFDAESFASSGGSNGFTRKLDLDGYGNKYIETRTDNTLNGSPSSTVTYSVNVPSAGTYSLYGRFFVNPSPAYANNDSLQPPDSLGGSPNFRDVNDLQNTRPSPNAYHWVNLNTGARTDGMTGSANSALGFPSTYSVASAGAQTFVLGDREDGLRIDAFVLSTNSALNSTQLDALAPTQPGVLAAFDFGTEAGSGTLNPLFSHGNVSATAFTAGPNGSVLTASSAGIRTSNILATPTGTSSEAVAVSNGSYASFTVTPDAGFAIDTETLSFEYAAGGSSGTRTVFARSSLDNFATNLFSDTTIVDVNQVTPDIDLSAFSDVTDPIEFRFYTYNDTGDTGRSVRVGNVLFSGTASVLAVVPEPSAFALATLALMSLGFVGWRRRRR